MGDLTLLYDLAAGGFLKQVEGKGRTLAVINNGGGRIFSRLPRLTAMSGRAAEWMINQPTVDLAGFAALWGMPHVAVRTADDFDRLPAESEVPVLLEVIPDPPQTTAFWQAWDLIDGEI